MWEWSDVSGPARPRDDWRAGLGPKAQSVVDPEIGGIRGRQQSECTGRTAIRKHAAPCGGHAACIRWDRLRTWEAVGMLAASAWANDVRNPSPASGRGTAASSDRDARC